MTRIATVKPHPIPDPCETRKNLKTLGHKPMGVRISRPPQLIRDSQHRVDRGPEVASPAQRPATETRQSAQAVEAESAAGEHLVLRLGGQRPYSWGDPMTKAKERT